MADVYKVGVAISLTNNVSAALKVIQRDVLGLGRTVDLTQGKFNRLTLAVAGAATAFAGGALLDGFSKLAGAGGELINAQAKMLQVGIGVRDVAIETAVAFQNANIAGTTLAGNLEDLSKLRAVLGDFRAANMALPGYEKATFALTGAGIDPSQLPYLVKALDMMGSFTTAGQIDPSKFGPAISEAISAVLTTHGLLTGQGLYQAVRLSGPAAAAMGEKAYLQNMTEILLALGNRGARGLEYGATTFIGGQMSKNSAQKLDSLHLTSPGDYTHEGGRWSLRSNAIAGYKMLDSGNIIGWIQQYYLPAVKKSGMSVLQASASLPQTLQLLITTVANMTPQIARSMQQQAQAQTADPYAATLTSLSGAEANFSKALDSLWEALGLPAAKMGVTILNDLSGGIRNFTQWVGAHPGYADAMDKVLLGLGVGLTVLGGAATVAAIGAMIGSGGTIALVAGGFVTLGTALSLMPDAISGLEKAAQGLLDLLGLSDPSHPNAYNRDLPPSLRNQAAPGIAPPHAAPPQPPPAAAVPRHMHGPAFGQLGFNEAGAAGSSMFADWLSNGAPVTITNPVDAVTVKNAGDIAKGANAYTQKQTARQLQGPNDGYSGVNLRATPSGSAALAMPGFA